MENNVCKMSEKCMLGCISEYQDEKKENIKKNGKIKFHKAPEDTNLFKKWNIALQTSNNPPMTYEDYICNSHFKESDYLCVYKTINGKFTSFQRLKKDAVPSIFKSNGQNSNSSVHNRLQTSIHHTNESTISKVYDINSLKHDLECNTIPVGWAYNPNKEGVLFALIDSSDFSISMMCAINNDMTVTLLVSDRVLTTNFRKKPKSLDDIVKYLLLKKDSICTGTSIKNKRANKCCGFILNSESQTSVKQRCASCKKLREKLLKKKTSVCWLAEKKPKYEMKASKNRNNRSQRKSQHAKGEIETTKDKISSVSVNN